MSNELIQNHSNELVETLNQNGGVDKLLKPLIREIHLFDTYIAGTTHLEDPSILLQLNPQESLKLVREQNKFDPNAIVILDSSNKKLGYIPEKDNIVFSRLMDAGKALSAKIKSIQKKKSFMDIQISIYLVDF